MRRASPALPTAALAAAVALVAGTATSWPRVAGQAGGCTPSTPRS
jgi:hypothetical protein